MPRKKLIYTNTYPYHIYARSNNKEWFYLPTEEIWTLFGEELNKIKTKFKFRIYAFVLMKNHYHLIAQTGSEKNLGVVMQYLQKAISRRINKKTNRINHLFGGPYRASLITNEEHYAQVFKYVYRNPVKAEITKKVETYRFSTVSPKNEIEVLCPSCGIDSKIDKKNLVQWLNIPDVNEEIISRGLKKTIFKPVFTREC